MLGCQLPKKLAPEAGLEPATRRLTAGCSTIELLWMQSRKLPTVMNQRPSVKPILPIRRPAVFFQKLYYLLVGGLGEVAVILPHSFEFRVHQQGENSFRQST